MARDSAIALLFVFGLVGGVLILTTLILFLPFYSGSFSGPFLFGGYGFAVGIASGVLVIVSATMVFRRPCIL